MAKKPKKAASVTKAATVKIRENAKRDLSPKWDNVDSMNEEQYRKHWHDAMSFYRMSLNSKDSKESVMRWMHLDDFDTDQITTYKNTKDWQSSVTMGSVAICLLKGMPAVRADFNSGRDSSVWLRTAINDVLDQQVVEYDVDEVPAAQVAKKPPINIHERVYDIAMFAADELEDTVDTWIVDPETADLAKHSAIKLLRTRELKPQHARVIKQHFAFATNELVVLTSGGEIDPQLREGYSTRSRKQVKSLLNFYEDINASCDMIINEGKVARPVKSSKATKTVSIDKIIEKLKYLKLYEPLKLVSINPITIVDAKRLWVYNTKTRKVGVYVANSKAGLNIKGTTIINFDETKSTQKSLSKPVQGLDAFKRCTNPELDTYLDYLTTVDTKLNGRINEDTILLKVIV